MNSRRRNILLAIFVAIGVAAAFVWLNVQRLEPTIRDQMVQFMEERFYADVQLEELHLSLIPSVRITGRKLILRYKGQNNIPPLISIDEFTASSTLMNLLRKPATISELNLVGLVINIPPDRSQTKIIERGPGKDAGAETPARRQGSAASKDFVVDKIIADGATLNILPKNPNKEPMVFEMYRLTVTSVSGDRPMQFVTQMKNAKPPGKIDSRGQFGPWNSRAPGNTPVSGQYVFQDADLSVFKGIAGKLSSTGKYRGVLQRIEVDGTTDTPDFALRTGNHPVHLTTDFHAIVDGTDGDTLLEPVNAKLGSSVFLCKGGIYKKEHSKDKSVVLDVTMNDGKIEDLLSLVVPTRPALVGSIQFHSAFELPPGDEDVIEKLNLKGTFHIERAEFTSTTVQEKIETLSLRSRGKHEEIPNERIVSDMSGIFVLRNSSISFSALSFAVPGARVKLAGAYGLSNDSLNFHGSLQMDAKLSQTQQGIKSILLKAVDPFFRKNNKTVLPIKVMGTVKDVSFGLDLGGDKES